MAYLVETETKNKPNTGEMDKNRIPGTYAVDCFHGSSWGRKLFLVGTENSRKSEASLHGKMAKNGYGADNEYENIKSRQ